MSEDAFYTEKGFLAAAAFLLVLVFVGVAVAISGGGKDSTPAGAHTRPVDTGGSLCGLPAGSQDPVVGPPDARWQLVGSIAAPSIPHVGPGVVKDSDRRCYAHSPIGALAAAANLVALAGLPKGSISDSDELRHYVPSDVRDVYAKQPAPPVDPAFRVQVAGFKTAVVDRDNVTVTLALRTNVNGAVFAWTMPMRWTAPGDWRLQLASLQEPFIGEVVPTMSGFVEWSGA